MKSDGKPNNMPTNRDHDHRANERRSGGHDSNPSEDHDRRGERQGY